MHFHIILTLLVIVAAAYSHDVIVGQNNSGKKIFDEKKEASPAIWRQVQNVTVNTTNDEVISRIVVTDLRPEKDGDAKIVDGGEGQKTVTVELKSPTALRGYDFHIEVYSVPDKNQQSNTGKGIEKQNNPDHPSQTRIERNPEDALKNMNVKPVYEEPSTNLDGTTKLPELPEDKNAPVAVATSEVKTNDNTRKNRDTENKKGDESNVTPKTKNNDTPAINPTVVGNVPAVNNEQTRNNRDTENHDHDKTGVPRISIAGDKPRLVPTNVKIENATIAPAVLGKDLTDEQARLTRETQNQGKTDEKVNDSKKPSDEQHPSLIPISVGRNIDSTTETLVNVDDEKLRNTRDVQVNGKPGLAPSNVGKDVENTSSKPTTNDERIITGNVPYANPISRNVEEKVTPEPVNDDKARNARETQSNAKNTNDDAFTMRVPLFAESDVNTKTTENTPINSEEPRIAQLPSLGAPIRKITPLLPPISPLIENNDKDAKTVNVKDDKSRNSRDTEHDGKTEENVPRLLIDNNGQKLNPPKEENKNAENATNVHRHKRDTEKALKNAPAVISVGQKQPPVATNPSTPKTSAAPGKPRGFVDNRGDRRYSLPYPLSANKPTSSTTAKAPSKRDAESLAKPKDDAKLKETPKAVGVQIPKQNEHKPVISIQ